MWMGGNEWGVPKGFIGVLVEVPGIVVKELETVLACKGFVGFLFLKTEVWAWLPPCPCAIPNAAAEEHKDLG